MLIGIIVSFFVGAAVTYVLVDQGIIKVRK